MKIPANVYLSELHKSCELTASCKDGEAWNGNTVYYYDVVDEYR